MTAISKYEIFRINDSDNFAWGSNQEWYLDSWQRTSGCGPATCANLVWYLSKTFDEFKPLFLRENNDRTSMLELMEELWTYITPTRMGVNNTSIFAEGATKFGLDKGVKFKIDILKVPVFPAERPEWNTVKEYLQYAFSNDSPVAFLNLSNGKLKNLESWHWVTLTGIDEKTSAVTMLDQGKRSEIDLKLWLDTSAMGGGFVRLSL